MNLQQLEELTEVNGHPTMYVPKDDLKQLIALVRLQHEALRHMCNFTKAKRGYESRRVSEALAAFDAFEKGEVK